MTDLTVIIPARNEEFLGRTIQDILENVEGNTEVIAILDGYLPNPPLDPDPRVTVIYNPVSVGQRAAANQAAKIAKSKYLMKVDAHCAFDKGFDVKMLEGFKKSGDNVTMIPVMRNLHVFNWVCKNGHKRYQSKEGPCEECKEPVEKDIVWYPKPSPQSTSYRFDKTMHFQYYGEYKKTEEYRKDLESGLTETMSIQGSCFMITKKKWFELDICSEEFHSWGQQGVEVACKTWLSGGRVLCNQNTWYAHLFRTGNFGGFPYHNPQSKVKENREMSKQMFQKDNWPKATRKFQWLLDKFNPPDWTITKGMIYYTDNQLDEKIAKPVRDQLLRISRKKRINITSSSLKKMEFGVKNIHFPSLKRGYLTMFKQILGALENSDDDIIFFTEHDVLYHPSHFDFDPPKKDVFYYNQNVWYLRTTDGHALHYDVNQLSGLCVYRETAITHFRERYEKVKKEGFTRRMGFEPFTHKRIKWDNWFEYDTWMSEYPNVDIKHGKNETGARWKKEQYRNQQLLINWVESENYSIPGWDSKDLIAFN
jgi:glycosyltransferase involved in cell wall biosynthesis